MNRLFIFLLFITRICPAATYYVSASATGAGNGLSTASPWTYEQFTNVGQAIGDSVKFRRGDRFVGQFAQRTGVHYADYGTGAKPIFSGMQTVSSWTSAGSNLYWTPLTVQALTVVTLNGKLQGPGRYPKTGYLTYTGHTSNTALIGSSVASIPFNPTGADVVYRSIRQVMDISTITGRSGNTLSFVNGGAYQTNKFVNGNKPLSDGFGYFIQNSLSACTQLGDWFYNTANARLYMYFPTVPANYTVRVATKKQLLNGSTLQNNTFRNLLFEGANYALFNTYTNANTTFLNCDHQYARNAFSCENQTTDFTIKGGTMQNLTNDGVWAVNTNNYAVNNVLIESVRFKNIALIAGLSGSSDGQATAVWITGKNLTVRKCRADSLGYLGLMLYGSNALIEYDTINAYGRVKDDAGAIYGYEVPDSIGVHTNIVWRYNLILNGRGTLGGTNDNDVQVSGIYPDARVPNLQIYGNTVIGVDWAGQFFVDVGANINSHHNIFRDCLKAGTLIYSADTAIVQRSLTLSNNDVLGTSPALYIDQHIPDDISLWGTWTNNKLNRIGNDNAVHIQRSYSGSSSSMKLKAFKEQTGLESGSVSNVRLQVNLPGGLYLLPSRAALGISQ